MGLHTKTLSKSCFYHICSFRQIRSSLDDAIAASVASALVSSRLDQMNSVLYGSAVKHTSRLQRVQRALARVVVNQCSRPPFSSNELLKQLHWLPLEWRIQFKLATLTFILVTRHISLTSCNTISPQGLLFTLILFSSAIYSAT